MRAVRLLLGAVLAVLAFAPVPPASAHGITRIQQSSGAVQEYRDVRMRLTGETLWVHTADHQGVLEIDNGACSFAGDLERCLPYAIVLHQHGQSHTIALERGTVFINLTDQAHQLHHSSDRLGPHDVLAALHTMRGTLVSVRGHLDEVKP